MLIAFVAICVAVAGAHQSAVLRQSPSEEEEGKQRDKVKVEEVEAEAKCVTVKVDTFSLLFPNY